LKVLVLGIDGAPPNLIDEWIEHLPTFRRFRERGILGKVIPPIPAQTPVAWATFTTGKNPGNHGIFSFALRSAGTYKRKIIGPEMLASKSLWCVLRDNAKRIGLVNVPMSDVEEVKGFIIPGFLSRSEGIPYPSRVRDKIRRRFRAEKIAGDLGVETLERVRSDPALFFRRVNDMTDEMADVSLYLLEEESWDFFMMVFMGMDRINHFFWKHIDKAHPKYEANEYSRLAKEFYIKIDRITDAVMNSVDNTLVILLSDHGFCSVGKEVMVNNYLEELGLLERSGSGIDPRRSKAVSYGYGDIWLNVRGREPNGLIEPGDEYEQVRDMIISQLGRITIKGELPFKHVKKREEIYRGSHLNEAPDLLAIFNVGWQAVRRPEIMQKRDSKSYINEDPMWSGGHDGAHDPADVPGVLGLLGPGVQGEKSIMANLCDMAPTILDLMGISIPNDMDGISLATAITSRR